MRDFMAAIGHGLSIAFASMRESVAALLDQQTTADDLMALVWFTVISLIIVLLIRILDVFDKRHMR